MTRICAHPTCGDAFEAKRTDARFCSDTCRAKASKARIREGRVDVAKVRAGRQPLGSVASPVGVDTADGVAARLTTMEQRLAAVETVLNRADATRTGRQGDPNHGQATIREGGSGVLSAEKVAAAIRAEVGTVLAKFAKRLNAVELAQIALRTEISKLTPPIPGATEENQMTLAKAVGKLSTRVSIIERDLRAFNQGVVEALGEGE